MYRETAPQVMSFGCAGYPGCSMAIQCPAALLSLVWPSSCDPVMVITTWMLVDLALFLLKSQHSQMSRRQQAD
ncbi:hypothetical protein Y1Q_0007343 [Alligator mississippiensis]|uniref:Uncharacterized protein n=1 Tax=Alligator mississippiensis TaxID=8496 RepID=A0A151P7N5_ALLMI|nr:hypothetical protein Y1Q_0007343 [Alligator mississippiensis]